LKKQLQAQLELLNQTTLYNHSSFASASLPQARQNNNGGSSSGWFSWLFPSSVKQHQSVNSAAAADSDSELVMMNNINNNNNLETNASSAHRHKADPFPTDGTNVLIY